MTRSPSPFPYYLAALLAIFIGFLVWSARQAATDGARITDHDYYAKGLRYNTTEVERRAASVLGWQVASRIEQGNLIVELHDKRAQPVSNAHVRLISSTPGSAPLNLELREVAAGRYLGELPEGLSGEIAARIEIERDGARLAKNTLISLPH